MRYLFLAVSFEFFNVIRSTLSLFISSSNHVHRSWPTPSLPPNPRSYSWLASSSVIVKLVNSSVLVYLGSRKRDGWSSLVTPLLLFLIFRCLLKASLSSICIPKYLTWILHDKVYHPIPNLKFILLILPLISMTIFQLTHHSSNLLTCCSSFMIMRFGYCKYSSK